MAILSRGNDNWKALEALIERVGTPNVLYAIAAINRDKMLDQFDHDGLMRQGKMCNIVERAANAAAHSAAHTDRIAVRNTKEVRT